MGSFHVRHGVHAAACVFFPRHSTNAVLPQMTTYKVLTTIKANALVDDAPQRRADAARANGYSVAQLGPGSAQTPPEEELLETWLLLEVRPCTDSNSNKDMRH